MKHGPQKQQTIRKTIKEKESPQTSLAHHNRPNRRKSKAKPFYLEINKTHIIRNLIRHTHTILCTFRPQMYACAHLQYMRMRVMLIIYADSNQPIPAKWIVQWCMRQRRSTNRIRTHRAPNKISTEKFAPQRKSWPTTKRVTNNAKLTRQIPRER